MIFFQIQWENSFLVTCKHRQANFFSFMVFVCAAVSFTAKISSFEAVAKREAESRHEQMKQ